MEKLLRYIIPVALLVVAFISGAKGADSFVAHHSSKHVESNVELLCVDEVISEQNLSIATKAPRATINTLRSLSKRFQNLPRYGLKSMKYSRLLTLGTQSITYQESLIAFVSFIKSSHRVIRLGRLVI